MSDIRIKLVATIEDAIAEAEHKAIGSLARYKFQMFGYWAAIWVHLNRIEGKGRENPFRALVVAARGGAAQLGERDRIASFVSSWADRYWGNPCDDAIAREMRDLAERIRTGPLEVR